MKRNAKSNGDQKKRKEKNWGNLANFYCNRYFRISEAILTFFPSFLFYFIIFHKRTRRNFLHTRRTLYTYKRIYVLRLRLVFFDDEMMLMAFK